VLLPNQKSVVNCAAAESEIDSQKLCRCRFRNRQPKTLLIQKLIAKKFVAANSKIGRKTMSLPIQKSTA
jgi:hypothetical protein